MALISLDHVSKIYPKGTRPALDDINLDIERGDFVFLVGASGSGKSTLLSLLLHEEEATDGEIRVAGNDLRRITNRQVPQYRRSLGFVFQDYKLLNNKTVWQNVAFALEVIGTRRSVVKSLVPKVLETVGLTGKEKSYPHELSGGEQQRVAIARAYVNHPQILLADEPTGNLDPTTSLGIMEVLDAINRTGTTVVMATHNEEIVNSMRKRVVELHTGKIVRDEEHGSYDSAEFFPDAEVTSKSHQALGSDAKFRPMAAAGSEGGVAEVAAPGNGVMGSVGSGHEDEGIARLAQSVHSGRTGRYGEAFAPLEDTLTWGKGIDLGLQAGEDGAAAGDSAGEAGDAGAADKSVDTNGDTDKSDASAPNTADATADATDAANATDAPNTDAPNTDAPNTDESTASETPDDSAALLAPPTPPAPPADSTPQPSPQPSTEEENR
ncbi:cell division ATP-binding protein FtsE [Bifidobacterium panos]|uniref:Cell division ATP-binding protein FtsE n=1 Tax=Bifidobacterium panos TaxID=2675321 RepID=A0ABX1SVJ8_9BIFI|nr:cell division ATP-binding protein FtsE [Bifidobacterium sp. DSM 109963]NMN01861.1 cell division protein FtsE [Bifidobacterium sp. DSM 109963]